MNCDATVPPIAASDSHFMQCCSFFFLFPKELLGLFRNQKKVLFSLAVLLMEAGGYGRASFSAVMLIVW